MHNKSKVSVLALAAMISATAFADKGFEGFYVEVEGAIEDGTQFTLEFCEVKEHDDGHVEGGHRCGSTTVDEETPTFVVFDDDRDAYLRKISFTLPPRESEAAARNETIYIFDKPFEDCTVTVDADVSTNKTGKGYAFLEITVGEYDDVDPENRLNCDNGSTIFPTVPTIN